MELDMIRFDLTVFTYEMIYEFSHSLHLNRLYMVGAKPVRSTYTGGICFLNKIWAYEKLKNR